MATQPKLAKTKKKEEEPTFKWEGTDKRGVRVKGELRGANQNMIKAALNFEGSPIHQYLQSKGADLGIPDAEDAKAGKGTDAPKVDNDDPLNGIG